MSTDQSFDSVQAAIDREAKRRRRVLLTYLGLLIVPIVIGGFVLAKAPSETEAVAKQVTPIVKSEIVESIKGNLTVDNEEVKTLRRELERQRAETISTRERLAKLENQLSDMRATMAKLETRIR